MRDIEIPPRGFEEIDITFVGDGDTEKINTG